MKQELSTLKQALQQHGILSPADKTSSATGSLLEQNYPNPFDQVTTIGYLTLAQAQQVNLLFTNLQGTIVLRLVNLAPGGAQLEVAAGSLPAGTYVYTGR